MENVHLCFAFLKIPCSPPNLSLVNISLKELAEWQEVTMATLAPVTLYSQWEELMLTIFFCQERVGGAKAQNTANLVQKQRASANSSAWWHNHVQWQWLLVSNPFQVNLTFFCDTNIKVGLTILFLIKNSLKLGTWRT